MSPERIRPGSARARRGEEAPEGTETGQEPEATRAAPLEAPESVASAHATETAVAQVIEPDVALEGDEEVAQAAQAEAQARSALAAVEAAEAQARARSEAPSSQRRVNWFRRIYLGQTHVDFVRKRRRWFAISATIVLAGIISLAVQGLNLGIEFVGGTAWTFQSRTVSVTEARSAVTPLGLGGATITTLGGAGSTPTIEVQARLSGVKSAGSTNLQDNVAAALAKIAHISPEAVSIQSVGPSWGSEVTKKALEALIVFFVLIALYISLFFEWRMALSALIAVAHDVLVTVGVYSLTRLEVTPDTVVAFLTILGYSLYDTIVVFDRVRDNIRQLGPSNKLSITDLVNLSMNQTLARSINTSLVAIMPILAVLMLGAEILGATTLEYFGFALLIGLLSGAYSSIFIASPLVAMMKEAEPRWRSVRERLAARGGDRLLLSPADIAAGLLSPEAAGVRPERARGAPRRATRPSGGAQRRASASRSSPARPAARTRRKGGRR